MGLAADDIGNGSCESDHGGILEQVGHMAIAPSPVSGPWPVPAASPPQAALFPRFTRHEYLATVTALQQHILRGDCYEINFCQEFFAPPAHIDPLPTWFSLRRASPSPFPAFYKLEDSYLLCATPRTY